MLKLAIIVLSIPVIFSILIAVAIMLRPKSEYEREMEDREQMEALKNAEKQGI